MYVWHLYCSRMYMVQVIELRERTNEFHQVTSPSRFTKSLHQVASFSKSLHEIASLSHLVKRLSES